MAQGQVGESHLAGDVVIAFVVCGVITLTAVYALTAWLLRQW